jgi:hypothetical protein
LESNLKPRRRKRRLPVRSSTGLTGKDKKEAARKNVNFLEPHKAK